jgi:hypothetical protein
VEHPSDVRSSVNSWAELLEIVALPGRTRQQTGGLSLTEEAVQHLVNVPGLEVELKEFPARRASPDL